jgi:serine/threonine-protein kinase RsbW
MIHKITISCAKENLLKVRHFVNEVLSRLNISELETHKMVLAVDEVCANLIIHSNECNPDHQIDVTIDDTQFDQLEFQISDKGTTFDYSIYQEPSIDEIISSKRKGGVGLILVKRIMDKVEFSHDKNHNICRLTKKIGS